MENRLSKGQVFGAGDPEEARMVSLSAGAGPLWPGRGGERIPLQGQQTCAT